MRTISICQDHKKLLAIRHFDFDLTDMDFVRYYESRTGVMVSCNGDGTPCNADQWRQTGNRIAAAKDIVYRLIRARMQDCWEIYCAYEMPTLREIAA